jgi:hypothetical protein
MNTLNDLLQKVETTGEAYNKAVELYNASKSKSKSKGDKNLMDAMKEAEMEFDDAKYDLDEYYEEYPDERPKEQEKPTLATSKSNIPVIHQRGKPVQNMNRNLASAIISQRGKKILPRKINVPIDAVIVQGSKKVIKSGSSEAIKKYQSSFKKI